MTYSPNTAMIRKDIEKFLAERNVIRVATIRKDGSPHISPLWYYWDGIYLWLVLGKGAHPRAHINNLRRDPRMEAVIDIDLRLTHGPNADCKGVLLRGRAQLSEDPKLQREMTEKILRKFFGPKGSKFVNGALADGAQGLNRVVVKMKPDVLLGWDMTKLGSYAPS